MQQQQNSIAVSLESNETIEKGILYEKENSGVQNASKLNEKPKTSKEIKQNALEFAQNTTAHGLPSIVRNENWFYKLMWLVCLLGSTGYCAYSVYTSIVSYFNYDVVTKINVVYENPIIFPAITICNSNMFASYEAVEFTYRILQENGVNNVIEDLPLGYFSFNSPILNIYLAQSVGYSNGNEANQSTKQSFSLGLNDTIIYCFYEGKNCDMNAFKWYFHYKYGNCYQFNSGYNITNHPIQKKTTSRPGQANGLSLLLYVGIPDDVYTLSNQNGAHIFIHNQSSIPTINDGISILPGTQTDIVLNKGINDKLPLPYNQCYDDLTSADKFDSDEFKLALQSGYTYRQKYCIERTVQLYLTTLCNCSYWALPKVNDVPFCLTYEEVYCAQEYSVYLYSRGNGYLEKIEKNCPLECDTEINQWTSSSNAFPSDSYADVLIGDEKIQNSFHKTAMPLTTENFQKSLIWLNIYYEDTKYILVTESPKQELTDLMGSVGGTMGLYLGVSFLSFVEIVELFLKIMVILIQKFKRPKVSNQRN